MYLQSDMDVTKIQGNIDPKAPVRITKAEAGGGESHEESCQNLPVPV